jgi:hypothetical protein
VGGSQERVAVYGWSIAHEDFDALIQLFETMLERGWRLQIYCKLEEWLRRHFGYQIEGAVLFHGEEDLFEDLDYIVSVGGDGTLLDAAQYAYRAGVPIVGINFGHLGFLTAAQSGEVCGLVLALESKRYTIEDRMVIGVHIASEDADNGELHVALNDLSIQKSGKSMLHINTHVDGVFLCTYWSDGLILSTPTGSTAYNISVGGPIVFPGTEAMVLCPIAPHNLSMRPLVLPSDSEIVLRASGRDGEVLVGVDARVFRCRGPVEISAMRARRRVRLVRMEGDSFFSSIREKLNWGLDERN